MYMRSSLLLVVLSILISSWYPLWLLQLVHLIYFQDKLLAKIDDKDTSKTVKAVNAIHVATDEEVSKHKTVLVCVHLSAICYTYLIYSIPVVSFQSWAEIVSANQLIKYQGKYSPQEIERKKTNDSIFLTAWSITFVPVTKSITQAICLPENNYAITSFGRKN